MLDDGGLGWAEGYCISGPWCEAQALLPLSIIIIIIIDY
jgi:hypothetical protein